MKKAANGMPGKQDGWNVRAGCGFMVECNSSLIRSLEVVADDVRSLGAGGEKPCAC